MHYSVALSDTQINISSTSLHVLTNQVENFKLILDLNLLTWLEYLSWIFWLDSNTWVKNSDSNRVLMNQVLDLTRSIYTCSTYVLHHLVHLKLYLVLNICSVSVKIFMLCCQATIFLTSAFASVTLNICRSDALFLL